MSRASRLALLIAVALEPFVAFAAENRSQLAQTGRLLAYALVSVGLALGTFALARLIWRRSDANAVALAVAVCVVSFFHYAVVFSDDPTTQAQRVGSVVLWLIVTIAAARIAFLLGRNPNVHLAAVLFAVSLLLLQCVSFAQAPHRVDDDIVLDGEPAPPPAEGRPNVYWIVLDSHPRPDVMWDKTGYDLTPFVSALEAEGLDVSQSSRTSYPRTIFSLASTLEMDYVLEPGHDLGGDAFADLAPVVVGQNETAKRFRALGYRLLYGEAGGLEWSHCREEMFDGCLPIQRPWPPTGELETSLLELTPLSTIDLPIPYSVPQSLVDGTQEMVGKGDRPFFAFTHILTPHFPYRYRDDCTARATPVRRSSESRERGLESFRTQVRCIDALVVRAVQDIVERDPSAIVIVQSDHGSDIEFDWSLPPEEWTPSQVAERYGAFNAMRLPDGCDTPVEGAALVNTFRIVFGCIEGEDPNLLEYRAFGEPVDNIIALAELTPEQLAD